MLVNSVFDLCTLLIDNVYHFTIVRHREWPSGRGECIRAVGCYVTLVTTSLSGAICNTFFAPYKSLAMYVIVSIMLLKDD